LVAAHRRSSAAAAPPHEVEIEIRKLMDVEDFGEGFTPNSEIAKAKFK
jgi:hypothetical protein